MEWVYFKDAKPKPGQKVIAASEKEWNLFTVPKHDVKDDQDKVIMTAEEQWQKIIEVYGLVKWFTPKI